MVLSAIGAGGHDEHNQLPRWDLAVHKLLSHADRLQLSRKEHSVEGTGPVSDCNPNLLLTMHST